MFERLCSTLEDLDNFLPLFQGVACVRLVGEEGRIRSPSPSLFPVSHQVATGGKQCPLIPPHPTPPCQAAPWIRLLHRQTATKSLIVFHFSILKLFFFLSSLLFTFRYCILFLIFCAHADMQRDANKSVRLQSPCPLIQQSGRENALISTHSHPPQ